MLQKQGFFSTLFLYRTQVTLLSLCVQVINLPLKVKRKARIQLRNSYVISKHLRGIAMPL